MKKFLLLVLSCALAFGANAQTKYATYEMVYAKKSFDIKLSDNPSGTYDVWVDAYSLDQMHDAGGFNIMPRQYDNFVNTIKQAKDKYVVWTKTATDYKVEDVTREMPFSCRVDTYFQYGKWQFAYAEKLSFVFRVKKTSEETKILLIIRTGELTSVTNQFMHMDGVAIIFSSVVEIDAFLDAISTTKIAEFRAKPKSEDLFKN